MFLLRFLGIFPGFHFRKPLPGGYPETISGHHFRTGPTFGQVSRPGCQAACLGQASVPDLFKTSINTGTRSAWPRIGWVADRGRGRGWDGCTSARWHVPAIALAAILAVAVGGVGIVFLSLGVCPRPGVRSGSGQWPRVALHARVGRVPKIRFRDFWWACLGDL